MSWVYILLFIGGIVLGIMAWNLEKDNDQVKKINRTAIKILFILSILLIFIGITAAYANILRIGLIIFIPALALFITRRTLRRI